MRGKCKRKRPPITMGSRSLSSWAWDSPHSTIRNIMMCRSGANDPCNEASFIVSRNKSFARENARIIKERRKSVERASTKGGYEGRGGRWGRGGLSCVSSPRAGIKSGGEGGRGRLGGEKLRATGRWRRCTGGGEKGACRQKRPPDYFPRRRPRIIRRRYASSAPGRVSACPTYRLPPPSREPRLAIYVLLFDPSLGPSQPNNNKPRTTDPREIVPRRRWPICISRPGPGHFALPDTYDTYDTYDTPPFVRLISVRTFHCALENCPEIRTILLDALLATHKQYYPDITPILSQYLTIFVLIMR
jgi:hypothetical protein